MSLSFILWAMSSFNGCYFGMAGKTIGSFKRNVWLTLSIMLRGRGYKIKRLPDSHDAFIIKKGDTENTFFIFGGRDERSQDLVQGFTAAGFFFDEVALMPESFVNQAVARCSVEGAKTWFNCNPGGPFHWFKTEWIDQLNAKNALRIRFTLYDNPSMSEKKRKWYESQFVGVFYERFVLGEWVMAEGVIYSMFDRNMIIDSIPNGVKIVKKWIGIDYGQANATVFLLIGLGSDNRLYVLDEYYHSGRDEAIQKSPRTYSKDYFKWKIENGIDGVPVNIDTTYIDPSAKGFITQLHEDGERRIRQADNDVLKGIELVSSVIDSDMFRVLRKCDNVIKELGAYRWDQKAQEDRGEDKPIKQYDHCMDALRYVVNGNRMFLRHMLATQHMQKDVTEVRRENRV
jgi:PBSX family phage terminase large subunit